MINFPRTIAEAKVPKNNCGSKSSKEQLRKQKFQGLIYAHTQTRTGLSPL